MKRIKAWFLALLVVISLLASLSGCAVIGEETALTMGQWLSMVAESFGLASYNEETPYFTQVGADNSYFSVFQSCAEWGIVEPSEDVGIHTALTYNDVLISLVNAGEFMDENATDKEKVSYAIEHFDSSIRSYWGSRYINLSTAYVLLETAVDQWVNLAYTEKVENIVLSDEVIDYVNEDFTYTLEENVITVDAAAAEGLEDLQPGDVFTLPATDGATASMYRVESVEVVDGQVVIVSDDSFSEDDSLEYIEEIQSQSTEDLDMGNITGIYDENGDPIEYTVNPNVDLLADLGIGGDAGVSLLSASGSDGVSLDNMGFFDELTGTLEFTKKDTKDKNLKWGIQVTIKKSSIAVKISRTKTTASSLYKDVKQETALTIGFSNVNLTKDVDFSWGELKKATAKLNYKTTIGFGVGITKSQDIGVDTEDTGKGAISSAEAISQFKDALSNIDTSWRNSKNDKSNEIYICKLPINLGAGFAVDLIIKGQVTITGEVKLSLTINGASGIEYKNKKIRYINKTTTDTDLAVDAKIEATLAAGAELKFLKLNIVDLYFTIGAGFSVKITAHLIDSEGHRLYSGKADLNGEEAEAFMNTGDWVLTRSELKEYLETQGIEYELDESKEPTVTLGTGFCFDWKLYPIAKLTIGSENSLIFKAGKALKLKIQWEKEFLGEDDALLFGHYDFPGYNPMEIIKNSDSAVGALVQLMGLGAKCTLANEPWPEGTDITGEETESTDETATTGEFEYTGDLKLSAYSIFIEPNEDYYLDISEMPHGYTLDDLEVVLEDGQKIIAYDEAYNKVTGLEEGSTTIVVRTKDKEHMISMAVTVSENAHVYWEPEDDGKIYV